MCWGVPSLGWYPMTGLCCKPSFQSWQKAHPQVCFGLKLSGSRTSQQVIKVYEDPASGTISKSCSKPDPRYSLKHPTEKYFKNELMLGTNSSRKLTGIQYSGFSGCNQPCVATEGREASSDWAPAVPSCLWFPSWPQALMDSLSLPEFLFLQVPNNPFPPSPMWRQQWFHAPPSSRELHDGRGDGNMVTT